MGICEQLRGAKFSKSVAGYNPKEVDGFLTDILNSAEQSEQSLSALQVKLDAYESRRAEIGRKEEEAYRLLEAARAEACKITDAAKSEAARLTKEAARKASEVLTEAKARAEAMAAETEKRSAERLQAAKQNADKILAAADRQGKTLLAERRAEAAEAGQKAAELTLRTKAFEARFRTLVEDTVRALSELDATAPADIAAAVAEKKAPVQKAPAAQTAGPREQGAVPVRPARILPSVPIPDAKPRPAAAASGSASPNAGMKAPSAQDDALLKDFAFAGGKLLAEDGSAPAAQKKYKPYDTGTVTYADAADDFDDIRKIMESAGNGQKDIGRFME